MRVEAVLVVLLVVLATAAAGVASRSALLRIDHVADGDTVDLTDGYRVRLVQIDTPDSTCWLVARVEGRHVHEIGSK